MRTRSRSSTVCRFPLAAVAAGVLSALAGCGSADAAPEPAVEVAEGFADFVEPEFPFIGATVDMRPLGSRFAPDNVATRGVVLSLGDDSYVVWDPDLLRMATGWRGEFMELTTMAQISYHESGNKDNQIPRILGRPVFTTGIYPGWGGADRLFVDPREPGPNPDDVGRGPLPATLGRWNGIQVSGGRAVLSYSVLGTEILEAPGTVRDGEEVGIARTFRIDRVAAPLTLVVAEAGEVEGARVEGHAVFLRQPGDTVMAFGVASAPDGARLRVIDGRRVVLEVPASSRAAVFRVIAWRGPAEREATLRRMMETPVRMPRFDRGGVRTWRGVVHTRGEVSPDTAPYVVDRLTLPLPNPWRRNVRPADIAFFRDGRSAAVVTFEGDVWTVRGIDRDLRRLRWQRFASGLYEPLGIEIVDEQVYVHSRDGIVRLHDRDGDGEADFYENFSNLVVQSIESREWALGFAARPGGGFYLGRGGALDAGPRTSGAIMRGFRAGSRHSGSVLEVSADGRSLYTFASGLREPFIGVHPRLGLVSASDQQGNFVPATPIYLVPRGGYHGVPATAHRATVPAETPPILWIPHDVDQSGASQVWVTDDRMGFGGDALIHLSYGRPAVFRVFLDSTTAGVQGALVPLINDFPAPLLNGATNPRDGSLYLAGFGVWGSRAGESRMVARVRHTGGESPLPVAVHSGVQGVVVRFATALAPASADPARFRLQRWDYRRTEAYGSGHFRLDGEPGRETLPVAAAHLSADRRSLLLLVPDMRPAMQLQLGYEVSAADGRALADTLHLTLNHVTEMDLAAYGFAGVEWRAALAAAGHVAPEVAAAAVEASAERGRAIFQRIGCVACHSVDGTTDGKLGPTLLGVYGTQRRLEDGTTRRADAEYLRESLLRPAAAVVSGYPNNMPSYLGVLDEQEIESVVLYIRSLGRNAP